MDGPRDEPTIARFAWRSLALIAVLCVLSIPANFDIAGMLMVNQDRPLLALQLVLVAVAVFLPFGPARKISVDPRSLTVMAVLVVLLCWWGHRAVLLGFDHARDEQMAVFDSIVFGHGRLVWPLPSAWQPYADALNLRFMLPVSHPVAWISSYLPGNAMLRAVVGTVADPTLTGPLLTAFSLFAVWRCARLIWPQDTEAASIAVLTLALSGQVLMTGMTAFAMPAHLAANLLWLWLFLKSRRTTDIAALMVAFVATGLHQPLPHPMFAAPFFLLMFVERQWPRLVLFTAGYAAIMLFWMAWPHMMIGLVAGPHSTVGTGSGYVDRLVAILSANYRAIPVMSANLLRFATWQWIGFLPLLLAGFAVARRDHMAATLAGGMLVTVTVMTLILASQGYGFGYRYLHGLLGNAALLCGYGWRALSAGHDRLRPMFWRAAAVSIAALLPAQMLFAHQQYAAYAHADASLAEHDTDYVLVNLHHAPFLGDLAFNRPDLSNRPIRLIVPDGTDLMRLARFVCADGASITVPDPRIYSRINKLYHVNPGLRINLDRRDSAAFTAAGCKVSAPALQAPPG